MTLDPKRATILHDLIKNFLDRTTKAADDMTQICETVNISSHEAEHALSEAFLLLFLSILFRSKPTTTPEELGQIMQSQYKQYRKILQ